jgi:3'-phosphoadenosine 5'-phosphosulfate sulfotransferase (PAPS reductase)/FAD synthetase
VSVLNPKVEESRIRFALRSCERRGLKIYNAFELVEEASREFGDSLAVSWSAGKCSTAVLWMALKFNPNVKVIFCDTTVLHPEDYEFKEWLKKEWSLNLIETKPVKPFWQVWKEYGPPTIRRQYYQSYAKFKGLWKRHTFQEKTGKPACCWFCKDKPFLLAARKHGVKAVLTGLRCTESRARMYFAADYGQKHFTKRYKIWKLNPILFWTSRQLDEFTAENEIPVNSLYSKLSHFTKGEVRNGCLPCTGHIGWEEQLSRLNPNLYRFVQKLLGQTLIEDYVDVEDDAADACAPASFEEWF